MKVYLDFDRDKLAVEIPEKHLLKVVQMKDTPFLTNPIHLLNEKLNTSNFSKKLRRRSLKSDSVCIVVSDKTRPVPNKIIFIEKISHPDYFGGIGIWKIPMMQVVY